MKGLFVCLVVCAALYGAYGDRLVVVSENQSPAAEDENETPDNHHPVLDTKDADQPKDTQVPKDGQTVVEEDTHVEPKAPVDGDTGDTPKAPEGEEPKAVAGGDTEPKETVVEEDAVPAEEDSVPEDKDDSNENEIEKTPPGGPDSPPDKEQVPVIPPEEGAAPEEPGEGEAEPETPGSEVDEGTGGVVPIVPILPDSSEESSEESNSTETSESEEEEGSGEISEEKLDTFESYEQGCVRFQVQCPTCASAAEDLTIETRPSTIHEPHDVDVTFPCTVVGQGFNFFYNPIIWYKVMPDGEELQMNTNAVMNEPWARTGRYSITPVQTDDREPKVQMNLVVTNIKLADNGTYRCELRNKQTLISTVTHKLIVPSPMADLAFNTNVTEDITSDTGNGTVTKTMYEFEELKPAHVSCRAIGGNPMPVVKIYRGKTDITGDFSHKVSETRLGSRGLEITNYAVEVFSHEFMPTADHNGEKLKCVAKVPHTPEYKRVVAGEMNVRYPPKFECEKMHYVPAYTQEYVLNCKIRSNPPVDMEEIYWVIGDPSTNRTNLTIGETIDGFSANATVNGDKSIHLVLTIDVVNITDFQTYNIRAKNGFGEHHYQIHLNEATTTTKPTTPKPTKKRPGYNTVNKPGAAHGTGCRKTMSYSLTFLVILLGLQKIDLLRFYRQL